MGGFFILLQCLIFGLAFIAVKKLLNRNIPAFLLLSVRFLFGALCLFLIGCAMKLAKGNGKVRGISKFTREEILQGSISGIILFGAFALQTVGANYTTPAKNGVFTDLFVVVVPIINMLLLKKFSLKPFISAFLTFIGATFVLDLYGDASNFNIGDLITIFAGILFALQFIVMERVAQKKSGDLANPYNFTVIQLLVVAVCSLIVSLLSESANYADILWDGSMWWIVYLCVVATAVAYLLQFFAQEKLSAENTAVLSCSEAMFTLLFSLLFKLDSFSWSLLIGFILMVGGMILSSVTIKNKGKTNEK